MSEVAVLQNHSATTRVKVDRLTLFAFLWAGQAIVHQEFFQSWKTVAPFWGWALTGLAFLTLVFPRSLWPFAAMVSTSILVGVLKWPIVANHILAENVINLTILIAILSVAIPRWRRREQFDAGARDAVFDRFAPVAGVMLIVIYYFAFIAKLNSDFLTPELSCANVLYGDLVDRLPFVPSGGWVSSAAIWGTLAVELAIPVLLTFRRTRYAGIILGLGFHFTLGLIGHRTFAAFAYALYGIYCMGPAVDVVNRRLERLRSNWGTERLTKTVRIGRLLALPLIALFLLQIADSIPSLGPLSAVRFDWAFWLSWSAVVAFIYISAIIRSWREHAVAAAPIRSTKPGLLWLMVLLIVLTGLSQYLGLKTKTSLTMYSNLRTEAGVNNHLFMPALRLADYQDDLVEVIDTDHPELALYEEQDQYITFFEFRRVVSETEEDFQVRYRRDQATSRFTLQDGVSSDPDLSEGHPALLGKLLYFRPVSQGDAMECLH